MDIEDIKRRKKALKLTTAKLAYLAELPVSTVSKIMTGETKNPSFVTIEKLDQVLLHEEMVRRVSAYLEGLKEYFANTPEEDINQKQYEKDNFHKSFLVNNTEGNLALNERLTVQFLHELGEDKHIELLDGHLIYNGAPSVEHQTIVQQLGCVLDKYILENKGSCLMFNVGINVLIDEDDDTLLIPDVAILCDRSKLTDMGIMGAPDLVMEVVSKSTHRTDYNDKMHKYMAAGVREYWIIDPLRRKVTTYIEGEPMMAYIYGFDEEIPVYIYENNLKINIGHTASH